MNYQCKGTITRTVKVANGNGEIVEGDVEVDCECEFEVTMSRYRPATRDDPAEGGECEPGECPECGTAVDEAVVQQAYDDDCDGPDDDDDPRDRHGNSLIPSVAAAEFGGMAERREP